MGTGQHGFRCVQGGLSDRCDGAGTLESRPRMEGVAHARSGSRASLAHGCQIKTPRGAAGASIPWWLACSAMCDDRKDFDDSETFRGRADARDWSRLNEMGARATRGSNIKSSLSLSNFVRAGRRSLEQRSSQAGAFPFLYVLGRRSTASPQAKPSVERHRKQ